MFFRSGQSVLCVQCRRADLHTVSAGGSGFNFGQAYPITIQSA